MTVECIYVPLMMTASKAADELSIASVTRGIENPQPRTCLVQIKCRAADWVIMTLLLFFLIFEFVCEGRGLSVDRILKMYQFFFMMGRSMMAYRTSI